MDVEKRKYRRDFIDEIIELKPLGAVSNDVGIVKAKVVDMSSVGIGFTTDVPLSKGDCYSADVELWTKGILPTVISVARCNETPDGKYSCGGTFVGMRDAEKLRIDIYQMFNDKAE